MSKPQLSADTILSEGLMELETDREEMEKAIRERTAAILSEGRIFE